MNINPNFDNTLQSIFTLSLGGDTFQEWIDRYNEQYDNIVIDGYEKAPLKHNYTFQQVIASTGATPLPTWVDPESPGYEVALHSLSGNTGNIPTAKQFYRFNRVAMREQMQLIQACGGLLPPGAEEVFMGLMDESTSGLIKSYHNALAHQADRINSTGKFTISADNNPRGLQDVVIDFHVPTGNFDTLSGTKRWWTAKEHTAANEGSASDPIQYLKDRVKMIRRQKHYLGRLELRLAKTLMEDLLGHSKVLAFIGKRLYPAMPVDSRVALVSALPDEALIEEIRKAVGVDKITVRDSISFVTKPGVDENGERDLIETPIENFVETNISIMPMGNIGTIQGVAPLALGYQSDEIAHYDGNRLLITQRTVRETHSIYIESEFAQICVPGNVNFMFISTVTA